MASGRERYERQAEERRRLRRSQRASERRRRRLRIVGTVVVGVIVVGGAGTAIGFAATGGGGKHSVTAASPSGTAASPSGGATPSAAAGTPVCDYTADAQTKTATSPGLPPDRKATGSHTLTLRLSEGTVVAALSPKAPCTVNSFQWLASKGFFTNTICHRLTTSSIYVLQCGDPTGTGSGGPGYTIPDENLTGATYPAGTLAMANTGQTHTGGSQFFLVYKATQLPPQYTPFGTVTSGLDVLTGIAAKGTNNANGTGDGAPNEKVTVRTFSIS